MTNTAVSFLEVRDFCPQEEYLLNRTDSNITMRRVNVSGFNSFTFPEFATPQGVVYGMCVLFFCPSNHTIHVFLLCDPESHCRIQQIPTRFCTFFNTTNQQSARMVNSAGVTSLSYPMFPCEEGTATVQHSMVCDFRQDCPDNSDESFCEHPSRTGFLCSNGKWFTVAACTVSWCVGSLLSLVPFLPGLSSWGLQGQAGLCRLAALDNPQSSHCFKWFTVIVILNFLLCLMTVAGHCASVFLLVRGLSKLGSLQAVFWLVLLPLGVGRS
ncbi:hypothetical protein ACOMHN_007567 [Nucella lapillus]